MTARSPSENGIRSPQKNMGTWFLIRLILIWFMAASSPAINRLTGQAQKSCLNPPLQQYRALRTEPIVFSPKIRTPLLRRQYCLSRTADGGRTWKQSRPDLTRTLG